MVGAASLFGILVGAIGLGGLSDYFGRKRMFIAEMIIFMVFLVLLSSARAIIWLVVFLFGIGVALGCDYPTAHLIISESIPSSCARPAGARRLRLPGAGRADRHGRRLSRPEEHSRHRRVALDVRRPPSFPPCS